jgi:hypothetical protein
MSYVIGAGFRVIHFGQANVDGYFVGGYAAAASGIGVGSGMERLFGAQTLNLSVPEPTRVTQSGDDGPMATFDFSAENLPADTLQLAARSLAFEAFVQGSKVETIDGLDMIVAQPRGNDEPPAIVMVLSRRAKNQSGGKQWETKIVPSATITPLGAEFQQRNVTPYRYSISTTTTDRAPWGKLLSASANGATAGPVLDVEADNPVMMHAFLGDATETNVILNYTPIATKVSVYVNGVKKTLTTDFTVDTSTKTVTFVTAPAPAALVVILHEYDASEIA